MRTFAENRSHRARALAALPCRERLDASTGNAASRRGYVQFATFLAVGVVNSALGLGVIFSGMYLLGLGPFVANALGYAVGIFVSFVLNSKVTFRARAIAAAAFAKFILVITLSYLANLACVWLLLAHDVDAAQVAGMVVYAGLSFVGCREFVFSQARTRVLPGTRQGGPNLSI